MDSQMQQLVPVVKLLGLSGATALTAYIASFSLIGVPAVQLTQNTQAMAKQWSRIYHIGKDTAPPFALACSAIFSFLAWQSRGIQGRFLLSPTTLYASAAVIVPCIAPYTLTVMWDGVQALEAKAAGKSDGLSDGEVEGLVRRWSGQNWVRASITGMAAVLSGMAILSEVM